jgi:uncharacterized protein (TIRG00374 family)
MSQGSKKVIKVVKILFGLAVTVGCLYLIYDKVDVGKSMSLFTHIPFYYFLLLFVLYLGAFTVRTFRWRIALANIRRIDLKVLFSSIVIGYAGNNVLPLRAGEFVRMNFFSRKTGVSRLTAISSIALERVVDGIVLLVILLISAFATGKIHTEKKWFIGLMLIASAIFVSAMVAIVLLRLFDRQITSIFMKYDKPLARKLFSIYQKVRDAIDFIHFDLNTLKVFSLTAVVWLLEGMMFYFAIQAINHEAGIFEALLCLSVVNFGLLVPSSPAYGTVLPMRDKILSG